MVKDILPEKIIHLPNEVQNPFLEGFTGAYAENYATTISNFCNALDIRGIQTIPVAVSFNKNDVHGVYNNINGVYTNSRKSVDFPSADFDQEDFFNALAFTKNFPPKGYDNVFVKRYYDLFCVPVFQKGLEKLDTEAIVITGTGLWPIKETIKGALESFENLKVIVISDLLIEGGLNGGAECIFGDTPKKQIQTLKDCFLEKPRVSFLTAENFLKKYPVLKSSEETSDDARKRLLQKGAKGSNPSCKS